MKSLKHMMGGLPKFVLLTIIFYPLPAYSQSEQTPSIIAPKADQSLLVAATVAGQRIFSVGGRGHILYSDDQGESWTQANSPTQMLLTAIDFIDDKKGWAVGHDSIILGTEDSGENWSILFADKELEKPLLDVIFFDSNHGLVSGAYGLIMRTEDGGKTWNDFTINDIDWHFNSILKLDNHVFIAGEAGTLLRSSDRGITWTILDSPYHGSFFGVMQQASIQGISQQKPQPPQSDEKHSYQIIIYGLRGHAFSSNDLGDSWSQLETGVSTNILGGTFTLAGDALLVGAGGTVLRQRKGDPHFHRLPYQGFENLTSTVAISDSELVIFGVQGVSKLRVN